MKEYLSDTKGVREKGKMMEEAEKKLEAEGVGCIILISSYSCNFQRLFHFRFLQFSMAASIGFLKITTKLKPIRTRERFVCSCFKESEKERCLLMKTLRSKMLLSWLFQDKVVSFVGSKYENFLFYDFLIAKGLLWILIREGVGVLLLEELDHAKGT
ncbi:unnamed protein product [Lactuca virosa]|uniref:Uncharacterized protein n=1 Tax=Lactuca virosa TaxID=75947 RepID=A0AAU9PGU0_9ASTR|nr:unnamed protein product [Lactuca virosa]